MFNSVDVIHSRGRGLELEENMVLEHMRPMHILEFFSRGHVMCGDRSGGLEPVVLELSAATACQL